MKKVFLIFLLILLTVVIYPNVILGKFFTSMNPGIFVLLILIGVLGLVSLLVYLGLKCKIRNKKVCFIFTLLFILILSGAAISYIYCSDKFQPRGGRLKSDMPSCWMWGADDLDVGFCVETGVQEVHSAEGLQEWRYKNRKLDGISRFYYKDGTLRKEEHYDDGRLIKQKEYDKNGKLKNGVFKTYHRCSWRTVIKKFYEDGFEPKIEHYYKNGQLKRKVNYKEGVADGIYETYYKDGKISSQTFFKEGMRVGIAKSFYKNGKIKGTSEYKSGELINRKKYDEKGQLISDENFPPKINQSPE